MPEILSTILLCLLIAAGLFFSIRKLIRDKRRSKGCCGGSCANCQACSRDTKKEEHSL